MSEKHPRLEFMARWLGTGFLPAIQAVPLAEASGVIFLLTYIFVFCMFSRKGTRTVKMFLEMTILAHASDKTLAVSAVCRLIDFIRPFFF